MLSWRVEFPGRCYELLQASDIRFWRESDFDE